MDLPPQVTRELARRLLAASRGAAPSHAQAPPLVNENLRIALIQLTGADGFTSILRRSVYLATAELPALRTLKVTPEGQLERTDQLGTQPGETLEQASIVVTAHLLELLVTFIGEPLTLRLVREACPEASLGE